MVADEVLRAEARPISLDSVDRPFLCSSLREKPAQIHERGAIPEG
jgi:hypothetical protein